ncbi:MAG: flavin reductase family protein [Gemmataceae bacterium]|nr:flavin reductase family protein [Gemmataceae bacterium]MDW8265434.1 flavin reductase family protein [Gemmataceae bacterium]
MRETDPRRSVVAALGRVPSGLFVVTLRRPGVETGMLVSWVQQCSFAPLLLSLAVKRGRDILPLLTDGQPFVVNILDDTQTDMIAHFGRGFALEQPAFVELDVQRRDSGVILSEALAWLECRTIQSVSTGDHELLIAEALAGALLNDGQPMVHVRKSAAHY